jgi:hypothetical protein
MGRERGGRKEGKKRKKGERDRGREEIMVHQAIIQPTHP